MARAGDSTSISTTRKSSAEVDAYIKAAPKTAQPFLRRLREIINANAPQAEERISYRMPYYRYRGHLLYFAAHRDHIGVYPVGTAANQKELAQYMSGKGTYRFPLDKPLPSAKIARLVKRRIRENERAAAEKAAAR